MNQSGGLPQQSPGSAGASAQLNTGTEAGRGGGTAAGCVCVSGGTGRGVPAMEFRSIHLNPGRGGETQGGL
jgi:hypothetical protein